MCDAVCEPAGRDQGGAGPLRILVLVSGSGTNLQALIDAEKAGRFCTRAGTATLDLVVSDKPGVYALERAKAAGIPSLVEAPRTAGAGSDKAVPETERQGRQQGERTRLRGGEELSGRILRIARERGIGLIILAGFLSILEGGLVSEYARRIINLHPALLPKYGGKGMYGDHVHRAVLASGDTESGCTVHLVDAGTDTGPVLLQRRVRVEDGDTAETLAERIHREEHIVIVEAAVMMIERLCKKA